MLSTLLFDDVIVLLKDVSDIVKAEPMDVREKLIGSGHKAYDTIPFEGSPTDEDILFYERALSISGDDTAKAVEKVAEQIYKAKGKDVVLVSLIRGGIPAGVLIKRYLDKKYELKITHYAITLIGTMGIDEKALEYILQKHEAKNIQFIDGWTGKGAISRALGKAVKKYKDVSPKLAVIADPANLLEFCGTHEDILIASSSLNALLAGLISRAIPFKDSFFGAIFFEELLEYDKTYHFINNIESRFSYLEYEKSKSEGDINGFSEVKKLAEEFCISDIHFIKPGMGETIRALIRKKPDLILVKNENNKYIDFVKEMAEEKGVKVIEHPLVRYNVCSIYKDSNSDVL